MAITTCKICGQAYETTEEEANIPIDQSMGSDRLCRSCYLNYKVDQKLVEIAKGLCDEYGVPEIAKDFEEELERNRVIYAREHGGFRPSKNK